MTNISSSLARQTREGTSLLAILLAGLFFFIVWKSSGMSLSLSFEDVAKVTEQRYQEIEEKAAGQAGIIEKWSWVILASVGVFFHIANRGRALFTWTRAWPLAVLLALIVLSVLWSSVPDVALRRAVKHLLLMAAVAGVVMGATSPRQIVRLAVLFTGFMMAMNFAAVLLFPGAAIDGGGGFRGLHGHKNAAGVFAMLTTFIWFSAARWSPGTWTRAILFCGTFLWFLFLLGTDSRTSILSAVVAILFILPLRHCLRRPVAGVIIALCTLLVSLCAIFALIAFNISLSDIIDFAEGERTTLTGRARVWQIAYEVFLRHPLLGAGYGSLWLAGDIPPVEEFTDLPRTGFLVGLTQAHSGYFDVLATLGLIGAIAFGVLLISVVRTNIRALATADECDGDPLLAELSGFFVIASLIYNLAQSTFLDDKIFWVFLVLCYLLLCSVRSPADRDSRSESDEFLHPDRGRTLVHGRPHEPVKRPPATHSAKARMTD